MAEQQESRIFLKFIHDTNGDTFTKFNNLKNKPFKKGHTVLLAKALSDSLTLPNTPIEDFNQWFLTKKQEIYTHLDNLSVFVFLENKEELFRLIKNFTQWRYSMFYNPSNILAIRGEKAAIEEMTGIFNFVDAGDLSSVMDVYSDITYYYQVFRLLATFS